MAAPVACGICVAMGMYSGMTLTSSGTAYPWGLPPTDAKIDEGSMPWITFAT